MGTRKMTSVRKKKTQRASPQNNQAHQQVVFNDYMHESVSNGLRRTVEEISRSGP